MTESLTPQRRAAMREWIMNDIRQQKRRKQAILNIVILAVTTSCFIAIFFAFWS